VLAELKEELANFKDLRISLQLANNLAIDPKQKVVLTEDDYLFKTYWLAASLAVDAFADASKFGITLKADGTSPLFSAGTHSALEAQGELLLHE